MTTLAHGPGADCSQIAAHKPAFERASAKRIGQGYEPEVGGQEVGENDARGVRRSVFVTMMV